MNNWKNYTVNIGHVKGRTTTTVKFESNKDLEIISITPSCGSCTKIVGYNNRMLTVKYEAPAFPLHLTSPETPISKAIEVTYADASKEKLKFVGFLKK